MISPQDGGLKENTFGTNCAQNAFFYANDLQQQHNETPKPIAQCALEVVLHS